MIGLLGLRNLSFDTAIYGMSSVLAIQLTIFTYSFPLTILIMYYCKIQTIPEKDMCCEE